MDFLGPIGVTMAAVFVLQKLWSEHGSLLGRIAGLRGSDEVAREATPGETASGPCIDFRFVLVGAFAPDVLDKVLAFWIAPDLVNHSLRNFGHSLLGATVLLSLIGVAARTRGAIVGAGLAVTAHFLLDKMWRLPEILLWPAFGWSFPPGDVPLSHWLNVHFQSLPQATLDWFGIGLLLVIVLRILLSGKGAAFIRTGRIT